MAFISYNSFFRRFFSASSCRILRVSSESFGRPESPGVRASAAAFTPLPHMNVYAATKSFVLHYTRALRWELHGTGITATALCPTWVKTGFEKVARTSGGGHDVGHLLGEQTPQEVVRRALCANKAHFAVACASPQSAALRLIGKVVPSCITMAGWDVLRRL